MKPQAATISKIPDDFKNLFPLWHFLTAEAMRRILIDTARRKRALKRGAGPSGLIWTRLMWRSKRMRNRSS